MQVTSTVQVDNERVKATLWRLPPGGATGHHVHPLDYVVVPLTDGVLRLQDADGTKEVGLQAGATYARPAGVSHNTINAGEREFSFVEIELK